MSVGANQLGAGETGLLTRALRPLRVCVVRPPTLTSVGAVGQDAVPPIGPAYLTAALVEAGHEVSTVDAVGEALDQYTRMPSHKDVLVHGLLDHEIVERIPKDVEVIGVSSMFSVEWPVTRATIEHIRAAFPDALLVLGGEHLSAAPEFSLRDCPALDVGVMGEGELTIVELLGAFAASSDFGAIPGIVYREGDQIRRTGERARIRQIDAIPQPSWSLWPVESYMERELTHGINLGRCMPLLASRGCPYQCTFCSSPQMWTTLWKARKPELVIAEIKQYMRTYGATNFDFYDLTAIVKKSWIVEFCQLLEQEQLDITWQLPSGTRSEAIDSEVAQWLYRSGCRSMNYAPESGSKQELARIKKKCSVDTMLESMRGVHAAGIEIKVNFIFGLPGETWHDVGQTFKFLAQLAWMGVDDVACFPFSAYPGTEMFDELVGSGKIEMDEDYFIGLLGYTDLPNSVSYSEFISSRQLALLSMAGIASFYSLNYLLRPWRALRFLYDALLRRNSSKLSMALANTRRKRRAKKLFATAGRDTVSISAS